VLTEPIEVNERATTEKKIVLNNITHTPYLQRTALQTIRHLTFVNPRFGPNSSSTRRFFLALTRRSARERTLSLSVRALTALTFRLGERPLATLSPTLEHIPLIMVKISRPIGRRWLAKMKISRTPWARSVGRAPALNSGGSRVPGSAQQTAEEAEVFFTLLAERYERRSTALTSNLVRLTGTQLLDRGPGRHSRLPGE